jgi:hypothetical protein
MRLMGWRIIFWIRGAVAGMWCIGIGRIRWRVKRTALAGGRNRVATAEGAIGNWRFLFLVESGLRVSSQIPNVESLNFFSSFLRFFVTQFQVRSKSSQRKEGKKK